MLAPGRWQDQPAPLIYAASSRPLALLEIMVHLGATDLSTLDDRLWIEIVVPDGLRWEMVTTTMMDSLDPKWSTPGAPSCRRLGGDWLRSNDTALLSVPSAVVPEEMNWLVNPGHPDFAVILAATTRNWAPSPIRWDTRVTALLREIPSGDSPLE